MTLTFRDLERLGKELAREENLKLTSITRCPKQGTVGTCSSNGEIKIRMQCSPYMFPATKDQENCRTLAHELAHLRHMNHNNEFWSYSKELCAKLSSKVGFTVRPEVVAIR
jgi:predicted metal-dependent hydrolase